MALKAGAIIHTNGTTLIERLQSAGPGTLTINKEKIYELGNYESVATIRDIPDLTFSMESLDVTTDIEAMLLDVDPATEDALNLAKARPLNVITQVKPGLKQPNPYTVTKSVGIPYLGRPRRRGGSTMGVTESGLVIRQSDLASFSYCAMRQKYDRTAAAAGRQPERLSATIAGTVAHYALEVMQRAVHEGREDALKVGLATFEHYWQPENTGQISEGPPTIWIARQTWGGVLAQMRSALAEAYEWMVKSKDILLATEYTFDLPIEVDGEIHTLHGTIDRLAIRMKDRMPVVSLDDWKGLALDTPIPTPDGWSTMADLRVGDRVFAKDGTPCNVVGKSQVKNIGCYEVKFDDGTSVICDEEHLWEVTNGRGELEVLPVTKIRDTLFGPQGQRQYRIFNPAPLELPEADLPIDPYVYGVWLGDGRRNGSEVTKGVVDSDIFAEIERRGQPVSRHRQDPSRPNVAVWNLLGLTRKLRGAGLLGKASVPDLFRRGSAQQRLAWSRRHLWPRCVSASRRSSSSTPSSSGRQRPSA